MKAVAVIPARAGSVRAKNKNFRKFGGTCLTELAIAVAKEAGFFSDIVISSDSSEALALSIRHGVHFHRRKPFEASDAATATDVLGGLSETFEDLKVGASDYIFYLQPTSPLRDAEMLVAAWEILKHNRGPGLVTLTRVPSHYSKVMSVRGGKLHSERTESEITSNQQDQDPLYLANGNIFVFSFGVFVERGTFPILGLVPIVQDTAESLDIDTEEDLQLFFSNLVN